MVNLSLNGTRLTLGVDAPLSDLIEDTTLDVVVESRDEVKLIICTGTANIWNSAETAITAQFRKESPESIIFSISASATIATLLTQFGNLISPGATFGTLPEFLPADLSINRLGIRLDLSEDATLCFGEGNISAGGLQIPLGLEFNPNSPSEFSAYIHIDRFRFEVDGLSAGGLGGTSIGGLFNLDITGEDGLNLNDIPVVGSLLPASFTPSLTLVAINLSEGDSAATDSDARKQIAEEFLEGKGLGVTLPNNVLNTGFAFLPILSFAGLHQVITMPLRQSSGDSEDTEADTDVLPEEVFWVHLDRAVGPVHFERAGIQLQGEGSGLDLYLDMSFQLGPLTFSLVDFVASFDLNPVAFSNLSANGLRIQYRKPPLEISGALIDTSSRPGQVSFNGGALIRAGDFSLAALAGFEELAAGDTSLFLYAFLEKPLGGPAFFFVEGIAAGFGYNRDLRIPDIDQVESFPLVSVARGLAANSDNDSVFDNLVEDEDGIAWIPSKKGSFWFAAGVKFSSFKLIHSFALLLAKIGNSVEFALTGISTLQLPKNKSKAPYVFVELAFKVAIRPDAGLISAEANLSDNSFVIDRACKITGGFAFYTWFDGPHKGDFVLTIGGYHPSFSPPPHYPQVPRLALNWQVNSSLTIKGEAYFALTPSSVMAGGVLEATFREGNLVASFTARANFLISWKPFFYDIDVGIQIKISYTIDAGILGSSTLSTQMGVGLHIWGPKFAGKATINWTIFSFDVYFGAYKAGVPAYQPLSFDTFSSSFLPADEEICRIRISDGLIDEVELPKNNDEVELSTNNDEVELSKNNKVWVVQPDELRLSTETIIPASDIERVSRNSERFSLGGAKGKLIGIRPMGSGSIDSIHRITITHNGNPLDLQNEWEMEPVRQGVPKELWGTVNNGPPSKASAEVLQNRLVGLKDIRPLEKGLSENNPPSMAIEAFAFKTVKLSLKLDTEKSTPDNQQGALTEQSNGQVATPLINPLDDSNTVNSVPNRLNGIFESARRAGFSFDDDVAPRASLELVLEDPEAVFYSPPMFGRLGSTGERVVPFEPVKAKETLESPVLEAIRETLVRVLDLMEHYLYLTSEGEDENELDAAGSLVDAGSSKTEYIISEASPSSEGVNNPGLSPGGSAILEVTPNDEEAPLPVKLRVTDAQDATLRVVALDQFGQLIKDEKVAVSEKSAELELTSTSFADADEAATPAASPKHIVVTRLPDESELASEVVGWRASSSLVQVTPRVYLGEESVMRTESFRRKTLFSQVPPESRREPSRDAASSERLTRGTTLTRENQVLTEEGHPTSGGISTLLPNDIQTLAIALKRSDLPSQTGMGITVSTHRNNGERLNLRPMHMIREQEDEVLMLYRLPGGLEQDAVSGRISILTRAVAGWEISGVLGLRVPVFQVMSNPGRFVLKHSMIAGPPATTDSAAEARQQTFVEVIPVGV